VYYVKDTKDPNWLVVVKTKPQHWYDMPKDTNEACQENEDIDSISFTFNALDDKHEFSLDISDLAQTTTNGNSMMSTGVIDEDDDEGSDDVSIDFTYDEEKNIIDEDDNDEN